MLKTKVLLFSLSISMYFNSTISLMCLDENNNKVDWYVLYKLPHVKGPAPSKLIKKGVGYLYITSKNVTAWTLSELSINSSSSFLANTLRPIYEDKDVLHILYNDEPPNKKSNSKKGHTKGVVIGDENGGVWVVHSVPLFPPPSTERYAYPNTGAIYGQSILCISLDENNFDKIGIQLQYNQPYIYSSKLPFNLNTKYPHINDVINYVPINGAPWYNTLQLKSKGGMTFTSFAKTRDFGKDLYEDWVAPTLNVGLLVETWLHGPGKLPSDCSKLFSVKNIEEVKLDAANLSFKSTSDHSKWAVSNISDTNWICIGDINRAEHQKHRGGGTVCFDNSVIAKSYRSSIVEVENCRLNKMNEL